jgi:hypothetical protein
MNSVQYLNPDLEIPNNLARFLKKWGFIRMPNEHNTFPTFFKASRNNVFELVFANWSDERSIFCDLIYLNGISYHIGNEKIMRTLKESH